MRTTLTPIVMFLCLALFVLFANSSLLQLCDDICERTKEIEFFIEDEDFQTASKKSNDLIDFITAKTMITAVYINHSDFDNFIDEANELSIYTKCEDSTNSLIAANSLKELAKNIRHLHQTKIENIF